MLSLPPSVRIFVCTEPADMRRSFDGLAGLVREFLGGDPLSGHFFVFRNKKSDRLKLLYWDRDGLVIWYKRLEEGTFRLPSAAKPTAQEEASASGLEITATELALLLGGIDLRETRQRRRYQAPPQSSST
jgi:transposase